MAACPTGTWSDRAWQRQPVPGGGALEEDDVVAPLRQVPQTGKLAHIEQVGSSERCQHPQIVGAARNRSRNERIAGRERKRPIGSYQTIQPGLNKIRVCKSRRDDRQAQLDDASVAAE